MFCYWYRDCHGKDVVGFDSNKFKQTESVDIPFLVMLALKEGRCFEFKHKPTSIRMVYLEGGKITYSAWNS